MNRREFLETGIVLAGSAALGELHAARQAFSGGDQSALHETAAVASRILQPLHPPGALWLSTQGDPGTMRSSAAIGIRPGSSKRFAVDDRMKR